MVIESFASVFEQERRLHSIEVNPATGKRMQISTAGLPLRGLLYYVLAFLAVFWLVALPAGIVLLVVPPLGWMFGALPFVLQALLVLGVVFGLPGGMAYSAMVAKVDGRPAHLWLLAWASWRLREKRTCNGRRVPREGERYRFGGRLKVRWDLSGSRLRRVRARGPMSLDFAVPVRFSPTTRGWRARPSAEGLTGRRDVAAGEVLEVRP